MKEKAKLKKLMLLSPMSCDAIKEELEAMALKGWKLKCAHLFLYEFEKIEPKKLIYTVDYFPQASVYDTKPEAESIDYIEYCKEAGWDLVVMNGTLHIFVSENEDVIPIHTDEKLKLDALCKSILKTYWSSWFLIPFIFAIDIALLLSQFKLLVTSDIGLFNVILYVGVILFSLSDFFVFLCWKSKNKKRIENGEKLKYFKLKTNRRILQIRIAASFALIFCVPLLFSVLAKNWDYVFIAGIGLLIAIFISVAISFLDTLKLSRITNIAVQYVIAVIIVLAVCIAMFFSVLSIGADVDRNKAEPSESFAFIENPKYTYTVYLDKSILASEETVSVESDNTYAFKYIIFKSNSNFIMEKYYDEYYKTGYSNMPQEKESWSAKAVCIRDDSKCLLVVYDNAIIEFIGLTDFTAEQKNDIAVKLNNS